MTWPNATDYNAAVQNPQLCFRDEDLRQGQAAGDLFGLPRPHSGNFADVYQIQGGEGQSWAVKCFTRPVSGLRLRYHAISEYLRQAQRAFMVEFDFLDQGICIRGQWHPLVKMRWVEGFRLNEFVREHLNKPVLLDRLAHLWVRLSEELRDAGMAHGDLQHGNVLLVPGNKSSSLSLKLVDYDGMFVPALADRPSDEVGHPNYQHPRRLREGGYDREMDRFSHLLIYTALRGVRIGGEELWLRYDNQENLLFREEDFLRPSKSRLLHELWEMPDRNFHSLVGHLLLASQGPLGDVPTFDELVDESNIRPLSPSAEARVNDLLDDEDGIPIGEGGDVSAPRTSAPKTRIRSAYTTIHAAKAADTAVLADTKTDTKTITLEAKTAKAPVPPVPQAPRRSAAEIELDAQPPASAAEVDPALDTTLPADPIVSMLSHPAWLATFGVIALLSFLVVNMMVSSAVKEAPTAAAALRPAVKKKDRKQLPPPSHEQPPPRPKQAQKESAPLDPSPRTARLTEHDHSTEVRKEEPRVRLKDETPSSLSIEAGTKAELRVLLDRSGYKGKVEVQLKDLPPNVTAQRVAVPSASSAATVHVETKVNADRGEHPIKLLVRADNRTVEERTLTLLVRRPRGRQEKVHFSTVDHMPLAGTLYHGWKGKNGMTVLMLHDLGRNRSSPGWKRLAEALQAEGHTVLTFDFRGHGESKKVSTQFWTYPVNKSLPMYVSILPPEEQAKKLDLSELPSDYRPWLVEDIAAARTFLDLRHDKPNGPVNTFNLVVIGAGQASALGSFWLGSEGLRYNAVEKGKKIMIKLPEKLSIRQAEWIGMGDPLKLSPFGIHSWLDGAANIGPAVPITFIYGEDDVATSKLLALPIRKKYGDKFVIPGAHRSGQSLLDTDSQAAARTQQYLVETLESLPPVKWVPRQIKKLRSLWGIPQRLSGGEEKMVWFEAKHAGKETVLPVPFMQLGIRIKGLEEPTLVEGKWSQ